MTTLPEALPLPDDVTREINAFLRGKLEPLGIPGFVMLCPVKGGIYFVSPFGPDGIEQVLCIAHQYIDEMKIEAKKEISRVRNHTA